MHCICTAPVVHKPYTLNPTLKPDCNPFEANHKAAKSNPKQPNIGLLSWFRVYRVLSEGKNDDKTVRRDKHLLQKPTPHEQPSDNPETL